MYPTNFYTDKFSHQGCKCPCDIMKQKFNNSFIDPLNKISFQLDWNWNWGVIHYQTLYQSRYYNTRKKWNCLFFGLFLVITLLAVFRTSTLSISFWHICKTIKRFIPLLRMIDLIFVFHLFESKNLRNS